MSGCALFWHASA